jgi:outer membrane protein assembly factor BamB
MNATMLGVPQCGDDNVQWTMTASRENAYIVYTDGTLYAVDLTTLACILTPFQPNQLGIQPDFGIAVAGSGAGESFYVYGEGSDGNPILAVSDLSSFVLTKVGDVLPVPPTSSFPVNLTADSMGHLYAFSPDGLLQEIDAATGTVLQAAQTDIITMSTWASLTGGSEVVLFVDSRVASYDLASGAQTAEADSGVSPVGAGTVLSCPGQ